VKRPPARGGPGTGGRVRHGYRRFVAALANEQAVTQSIHGIYALAVDENDIPHTREPVPTASRRVATLKS